MTRRVAVISYAFRFPGTTSERFWEDLLKGRNLVTKVQDDRWEQEPFFHPHKNHPGTSSTFAAGSIGDIAGFDAHFFGISPREAAQMDPQQRLLLEMSWEALENGGILPSSLRGSRCGVFIGIASTDYAYRLADDLSVIDGSTATGNTASIAANRLSYVFDLCGPSMALDTACSSSLVAFHQACCSILSGESDQALTGGISLHLHPYGFLTFSKASMLSPRGKCSVFDAAADGYVRSEGGGIFFLKEYEQAMADGDPILAVVAASAINADGRKTGLTVPNPRRQAELLRQVYEQAGIEPASLAYLEAHGTGTAVGDPVEARAIGDALGCRCAAGTPLPIGSIKGNLGHLEAASGVAGLVKALNCLRYRMIPATIGMETANPTIDFPALNIQIVTRNQPLPPTGTLTVGVNSFGFGGANAHVILQTPSPSPSPQDSPTKRPSSLLPLLLSAKNEAALPILAGAFADLLEARPADWSAIAFHAAYGRERLSHRAVAWGTESTTLSTALRTMAGDETSPQVQSGTGMKAPSGAAFIYSGNGAQWPGMGGRLLEDALFRETIAEIDTFFQPLAGFSLADELAGKNGENRYQDTEIAQPALFALQVGLTRMLRRGGVAPIAVAGHSVGEVAAAWASGILDLESAVTVIHHRSRLQGLTKGQGQMTAVGLGAEETMQLLHTMGLASALTLAGINSYRGVTLAGAPQSLTVLEEELARMECFFRRLDLEYAFHSPAMDSIEAGIHETLATLRPGEGRIPFASTVTGSLINGPELDAAYWWHNIRKPVLFQQAIKQMQADGINVFIEVGPHAVLRSYLNDCIKESGSEGRVLTTLKRGDDDPQRIWETCGQAMIAGVPIDWSVFFSKPQQFVQLPTYPWQRERYWHPQTPQGQGTLDRRKVHPLLGYQLRQQELTWENQMDTHLLPTMADHVVGDATVFPGAGFAELALAAARARGAKDLIEIDDLEIRTPLILESETSRIVRVRIDEQDGTTTMVSREQGETESWTTHGVCRIPSEPGQNLLRQAYPERPIRQPDFTAASHLALTRNAGLEYGPAFQCIEHGWNTTPQTVLALLRIPEGLEEEVRHMHLHPALLDSAFQLIIQLLREREPLQQGMPFIPVRMGRIVVRTTSGSPALAEVTLLRCTDQSLSADLTLFDNEQQVVAVIKEARFRRIRLRRGATDRLQLLRDHWEPMPLDRSTEHAVLPFSQVATVFADLARRIALSGSHRRYTQEVDPLLEMLCSQWTLESFRRLAADTPHLPRQRVQQWTAFQPDLQPFIEHLLAQGVDDHTLAETPDGWEILPGPQEQISAQDIWNSMVADYPDSFPLVHAAGRIGMHLAEVIQGGLAPTAVTPQTFSTTALISQILGSEGKQKVGQAFRHLMVQGRQQLPEGSRLGVVEIGRSYPTHIGDILAMMDARCCDATFAGTAVSDQQEDLMQMRERYPCLAVRSIDPQSVSAEPPPPGHLVLVTLDFTTLAEATEALHYARACLLPGGSLIVIGLHPARWIDFLFGALPTHWAFTADDTHRSRQCSAQFWEQHLRRLRFTGISLLELSPDTLSGPFLLLAQPPEDALPPLQAVTQTGPRSWILLADAAGPSARLADELAVQLQEKGDMVVLAQAKGVPALQTLLQETTALYGQLDGMIHLAGLADPDAPFAAETEVERQAFRCTVAADLLQACEISGIQTTCWLVTQGVGTPLGTPPGAAQADPHRQRHDGALWGFGRTMMNEALDLHVRLVDLQFPATTDSVAALVQEFDRRDQEREVMLTVRGKRFAPRLSIKPRRLDDMVDARTEDVMVRLGCTDAGQLRNLRWRAYPLPTLNEDEIEVKVQATGLNFRDLMFTLGLLSEEAIENGFAGPTLGLEFSGIVSRVGSPKSPFVPGDKVAGFGPSCFADRVITTTAALTHLHPGISFEAAATIPCTFFTAYYALHFLAQLQPGERVLIHCAAGGVGIAAVQLAKWMGAEILVTAGSPEKRDFLQLLGVQHIFDSRSLAFADAIMAVTNGQGVDVVLNSLAGEAISCNFNILKPFGRFLELGKRDFYNNTKIGLRPFRNNISYFGIDTDQLMLLRPDLTSRLFTEVMELFREGVLHPLPYLTFEAEEIVDAFRYMQQARHIGKIVITYRNGIALAEKARPTVRPTLHLAENGTYLVTGGLGGFGLRTAQWLVERGARHLVLISRSGPASDEAKQALEQCVRQGVRVRAAACDVTDRTALAALMDEIAATMPPLKGIVHAATVIQDGLIRAMDSDQIRRVLWPKVLGATHLHELSLAMELDFFVLFSSATTLFGNPGQGNYVAANTALEALARQRRAAGLPATCVCWGAIEDVGFLARNVQIREALQTRMGGTTIHSTAALEILEELLLANRSGLGVMEVDWRALSRFLPTADSPKFRELARTAAKGDADEGNADALQRMLEELSDEEMLRVCIDMLRHEVGEILRMAPEKLDPDQSMYDMGLDSLMGVELAGALESRFGVRLSVMTLRRTPTIAKLAAYLLSRLKGEGHKEEPAGEQVLLDQVRHLTDQHGSDATAVDMEQLARDLQDPGRNTTQHIIV